MGIAHHLADVTALMVGMALTVMKVVISMEMKGDRASNCHILAKCSPTCLNGDCTLPGGCDCFNGWDGSNCEEGIIILSEKGIRSLFCFLAECSPTCVNGGCTAPGGCDCFTGWDGSNCNEGITTTYESYRQQFVLTMQFSYFFYFSKVLSNLYQRKLYITWWL